MRSYFRADHPRGGEKGKSIDAANTKGMVISGVLNMRTRRFVLVQLFLIFCLFGGWLYFAASQSSFPSA
jgi:hypothetical protein